MKNWGGGAPENKFLKGKFLGFTLNLLSIKKLILPCQPKGEARMILKKDEYEILRFTQNDKKYAFTLAEVLITLGIIGIVAAMTLPTVINRAQEKELEARFRKAYNVLETATQKTIADLGYIPLCYNWPSGEKPYPPVECISKDENGNCIYGYPDGSPVPSDYGGPMSECKAFNAAFIKNLNVIQKCTHTEEDGCTVHYKGKDTILKEEDDSLTQEDLNSATSGDKNMRESVLNKLNSIVLADSLTIVAYDQTVPIIDINGKKGPNKWGYDLFRFKRVGSYKKGIYYEAYAGHPVEKGGRNCKQMLQSLFER